MNSIIFNRIKENPSFLSLYTQGMSFIHQSGLLEVLRDLGRVPVIPNNSPNYEEQQKYLAAQSIGFNNAIDCFMYFREMFLDETKRTAPLMDFGSLDKAVEQGDLTKEEADAIRNRQPVPELKSESGK